MEGADQTHLRSVFPLSSKLEPPAVLIPPQSPVASLFPLSGFGVFVLLAGESRFDSINPGGKVRDFKEASSS